MPSAFITIIVRGITVQTVVEINNIFNASPLFKQKGRIFVVAVEVQKTKNLKYLS